MHDIDQLREDRGGDPERFREICRRRFMDPAAVDAILAIDNRWRALTGELDLMRKKYNTGSKAVAEKMKAGQKEEAQGLIAENKKLDEEIKQTTANLAEIAKERDTLLHRLPNFVHDTVPVSQDEEENAVVNTWGTQRQEEGLLSHVDLLQMCDMVDTERGTAVAGGRGFYLKGDGVRLNLALINYALSFLGNRPEGGYVPLQTPFFMQQSIMGEVAQLSSFDEELYKVTGEGEDKYLIATSEQPIAAYHRKEWLNPAELPIRYAGYSTCFRKEVGSHGRDTTGIFRIHQFEKVEQFCITSPEDDASWAMLEDMRQIAEDFYRSLEVPYRVVNIVSGELNDAAAKKYDLEAWFPGSKAFRELVSCSNCLDYQSRRLEVRFGQTASQKQQVGHGKEKKYVHMLNATLCATERAMCCLAETHQTPEGIRVPAVLVPFMGGKDFIKFVKPKPEQKPQAKGKGGGGQKGGAAMKM